MKLVNYKADIINVFIDNFPSLYVSMKESEHGIDKFTPSPYHAEGDVWTHTMMVLNNATTKLGSIAALLHDVGKPYCRMVKQESNRTIFSNHEGYGFFMLNDILPIFNLSEDENRMLKTVVALHGSYRFGEFENFIEQTFGLDDKTLELLVELLTCDSNGRLKTDSGIWEHDIEDILYNGCREAFIEFMKDRNSRLNKTVTFLIGLPGAGKSTYLENNNLGEVLSRDELIEQHGKGRNYDEKYAYFKKTRNEQELNVLFDKRNDELFRGDSDVVIDMVNVRESTRNKILKKYKVRGFKARAVVFSTSISQCAKNTKGRLGKNIPVSAIDNNAKQFKFPLFGKDLFDEIVVI